MPPHSLARLGWRAELQQSIDDPALIPARVLAADRGRVIVDTGMRVWSAPLAGRLKAHPVTGDFVAVVPDGPVRAILPRRGVIARRREKGPPQVMAAHVDLALIATSLNRDLNARRVARFIAMTTRGDVEPVVLLTKADLVDDPAASGVEGIPVSVVDGTGLDAVRELLTPRRTAVLLGTSGVGKSTLVNTLVGRERQATQPIRTGDDRGRHTTVRRELITLPGGALLIDTPGLRLVAPVEDGDEELPLLDKQELKRQRRERERAFHRQIYRDMRARRRYREERER